MVLPGDLLAEGRGSTDPGAPRTENGEGGTCPVEPERRSRRPANRPRRGTVRYEEMDYIRTLFALLFMSAVLLGACGEEPSPPSINKAGVEPNNEGEPPACGKTNITSDDYGTEIDPTAGPPGTEVKFSGTTVRGEDWEWAPSDRLEAWWNTDAPASEVPGGTPVRDGPVLRLVRVDDMERCEFETTFTVPEVEPGRYKISVFVWDANPEDGYGLFLPHHFVVTDPAHEPPCDAGQSYGQTIPGRWLENVLVRIGAPGNHSVTHDQVGDTGTALSIRIPAYEDGPTLYTTMLAKPFPENEDWEAPEQEIGRHGRFELFITKGEFAWESYTARSDQWQLAVIAYPGPGNDEVRWPSGTVDWLSRAAEIAQDSPPQCRPD